MATQIPESPTVPQLGEENFDTKIKDFLDWISDQLQPNANSLAQEVETNTNLAKTCSESTEVSKNAAQASANKAADYANEAKSYKEYIESYVIPTEATYSPDTINQKVRRNKVLMITGGVR